MYDVIVVGARVAGSSTAMLLARAGLKVLAVDRVQFPSDTLSTHQVQVPAIARLDRWGLLDRIVASNAPATRRLRFDMPSGVLDGCFPAFEGVDAMYSPRRTVLDAILVDAAREAGAEVREDFVVREVLMDGGRVTGIRGNAKGGGAVTETARLVVGADGKHSMVARTVGAERYHEHPPRTMGCYTYWEGVPLRGGEIYNRPRRGTGVWPTNDGLAMTFASWPIEEFETFRADAEGHLLETLDGAGDLGERVRAGRRAERIRLTPDLPNFFRVPHGPGWALVGDAGLVMDPITARGIGDALLQAELLSEAVTEGLGGKRPLDEALAGFQEQRDRALLPTYEFTLDLASTRPSRPEDEVLFRALAGSQAETDRFLGVVTGSVPIEEYMKPANILKIVGVRGMAKAMLGRVRSRRSARDAA